MATPVGEARFVSRGATAPVLRSTRESLLTGHSVTSADVSMHRDCATGTPVAPAETAGVKVAGLVVICQSGALPPALDTVRCWVSFVPTRSDEESEGGWTCATGGTSPIPLRGTIFAGVSWSLLAMVRVAVSIAAAVGRKVTP